MASFVAEICGLMNMAENSLMGQFQISHPKLFTNSTSCHGFAFVKQKYGCRASNFSNCLLIVALLQLNMADPIWLTQWLLPLLRARNFGPQRNQGLTVVFLDNRAGGDLIYKILLKKLTWFLR